jgi:hypothetical protein
MAVVVAACSSTPAVTQLQASAAASPTTGAGSSGPTASASPQVPGTNAPAAASNAASSPGRIVFGRFQPSLNHFALFTMAIDGTDIRALLPGYGIGFSLPRWNWDGGLVAAVSGGTATSDPGTGLDVVDKSEDRGVETIILSDAVGHGHLREPGSPLRFLCAAWSHDDTLLACEGWAKSGTGQEGLYTLSSKNGSNVQRLTTAPSGIMDIPGDYSVDGRIAFVRATYSVLGLGEIWVANADGSDAHKLVDTLSTYRISWSHDGRWIVGERNGAIEIIDLQHLGADPTLVSVPDGTATEPRWSPDASRIVFVYTKSGSKLSQIATMAPDGSDMTLLTSGNIDVSPDWGTPGF